ncbi:hypothetical protein BHM03_00032862 [Ensete ventricosum]|nr:hypothetical protein BHM03_00032862 [Ensete ventricosum]
MPWCVFCWRKRRHAIATAATTAIPASKLLHEPLGLELVTLDADAHRPYSVHRSIFFSAVAPAREAAPECNFDVERACVGSYGWKRQRRLFPPPIPALASTGRLRCRMLSKLMRVPAAGDGRLVIKEFRAERHDCFRVSREGGRLRLQLVYADEQSPESEAEQQPPSASSLSASPLSRTESETRQEDEVSIAYSEPPLMTQSPSSRSAFPELCDGCYGHPNLTPFADIFASNITSKIY